MFNPCPCTSLQTGVGIIAAIDGVLSILLAIYLNMVINDLQEDKTDEDEKMGLSIVRILIIIFFLVKLGLAGYLFSGASDRQHQRCIPWLIYEIVYFLLVVWGSLHGGVDKGSLGGLAMALFSIYGMLVVYALMDELKTERFRGQPGAGLPFNGESVDPAPYSYPTPYPYPYQMAGPQQAPAGYYPQVGSAEQVAQQQYQYQYQYPPPSYNY